MVGQLLHFAFYISIFTLLAAFLAFFAALREKFYNLGGAEAQRKN